MCKRIISSSSCTLILIQLARDRVSHLGQFFFLLFKILFLRRQGMLIEPVNSILARIEEFLLVFGVEFTPELFLIGNLILECVCVVLQTYLD